MHKEEKALSDVTTELLAKTDELKENIKGSMMRGEFGILKGISVFEVILREINPMAINDHEINRIMTLVNNYLREKEELMQKVDVRMHYGINRCYMILFNYNRAINIKKR